MSRFRAALLVVACVVGLGCTNEVEDDEMAGKIPPWHLWGSSELVNVLGGPPGAIPNISQQLAQVRYKRPDTWRFILQMQINSIQSGSVGAANFDLQWIVTLGLGRSVIKIDPFAQFLVAPASFVPGTVLTVTSVELPAENAARVSPNLIKELVAETIQVDTRMSFDGANTVVAGVRLSAFFAPNVHVRPDWAMAQPTDVPPFAGAETGGQ